MNRDEVIVPEVERRFERGADVTHCAELALAVCLECNDLPREYTLERVAITRLTDYGEQIAIVESCAMEYE